MKTAITTSNACPLCQQTGKKISDLTLAAQVKEDTLAALPSQEGFRFCAQRGCPAVYYREEDVVTISLDQVRHPVFQKSDDPRRPVCYCFSHTVEEITEEVMKTGHSSVPDAIKANCSKGLDACERNNPQGSCCLGNVSKVVKSAQSVQDATTSGETDCGSCCTTDASAVKTKTTTPRPRSGWLGLGAVFSALLASACCWLPLLLIAFGASTAGVSGFFETWRPVLLGFTFVLLGAGFYLVYFRNNCCDVDGACTTNSGAGKRSRWMLWLATALVLVFAAFPKYAGWLAPSGNTTSHETGGEVTTLTIGGMTCEACAAGLNESLRHIPGVLATEVNYATRTVHVSTVTADTRQTIVAVRQALSEAGYTVEPAKNPLLPAKP